MKSFLFLVLKLFSSDLEEKKATGFCLFCSFFFFFLDSKLIHSETSHCAFAQLWWIVSLRFDKPIWQY